MPDMIEVTDVTLRDGLQDQPQILSIEDKIEITRLLVDAGYRHIELGSFMHPDRVPQMADTDRLLLTMDVPNLPDRHVLVPNARGLDRALATPAETFVFVISASDTHNRANLNRRTAESLQALAPLMARAKSAGRQVFGAVSTAFGYPEGQDVTPEAVRRVVDAYHQAGADRIILADTVGVATLQTFAPILRAAIDQVGTRRLGLHLHDGGHGVEPLLDVALEAGIRAFETAIGGLGGCPFAPGAPGNLKAEDLIPYLHQLGFDTGVDVRKIPTIALTLGMALGRHTA